MTPSLVPEDFVVPAPLHTDQFEFQVLGPEHNEQDQPAWTQSLQHIRATPGFYDRRWPGDAESLEQNLASLQRHREDYDRRRGYAYAVLDARDGSYLGCVYFYPPRTGTFDVDVRSWVRQERAEFDRPLHEAVRRWLASSWPWQRPDYAER